MMKNILTSPEAVEHQSNLLQRDYRNLRKAVMSEDPDNYTKTLLNRLNFTVEDTCRLLKELLRECSEKK